MHYKVCNVDECATYKGVQSNRFHCMYSFVYLIDWMYNLAIFIFQTRLHKSYFVKRNLLQDFKNFLEKRTLIFRMKLYEINFIGIVFSCFYFVYSYKMLLFTVNCTVYSNILSTQYGYLYMFIIRNTLIQYWGFSSKQSHTRTYE